MQRRYWVPSFALGLAMCASLVLAQAQPAFAASANGAANGPVRLQGLESGQTLPGTVVQQATRVVHLTGPAFRKLAARAASAPAGPSATPYLTPPAPQAPGSQISAVETATAGRKKGKTPPKVGAMPLGTHTGGSFPGLADVNWYIPPDTNGAAGPTHLVTAMNDRFAFFEKDGTMVPGSEMPLVALADAAGLQTVYMGAFDPHVQYDTHANRFVIVCLNGGGYYSWLYPSNLVFAISDGPDPTGGWTIFSIPAVSEADPGYTYCNWADYTALGFDDKAIYVTSNLFCPDGTLYFGVKLWALPKAQFEGGFSQPVQWFEWSGFGPDDDPWDLFTLHPAVTYDAGAAEYLVSTGWSRQRLEVWRVRWTEGVPALANLGNPAIPLSGDAGDYDFDWWLDGAPDNDFRSELCPERRITTNDTRMLDAEFRNGRLWCVHHAEKIATPWWWLWFWTDYTVIKWYEVDPEDDGGPAIVQRGTIDNPEWFFYFPSIAVNQNNDVAIGFSASSWDEYAGAAYAVRKASDPPGHTDPVVLYKPGEAPYWKGPGRACDWQQNRWGDFSSTCVDPADDVTFWTLQEYAALPDGAGNDLWGTYWAQISVPAEHTPSALDQYLNTIPNTPLTFDLAGADPDPGAALTLSVLSGPWYGSLAWSPASRTVVYTPNPDTWSFVDEIAWRVSDETGRVSRVATAYIRVDAKPAAYNWYYETAHDWPAWVLFEGSAELGGDLQMNLVSLPTQGTLTDLSWSASDTWGYGEALYWPNPGASGSDTFQYEVTLTFPTTGGPVTIASDPATVEIVNRENHSPVANDQSVTTGKNGPVSFDLDGYDPDFFDVGSFSIVTPPAHGTVTGDALSWFTGHFTYTPNAGFIGTDTFTWSITDGYETASATVTVQVTPDTLGPTAWVSYAADAQGRFRITCQDFPKTTTVPPQAASGLRTIQIVDKYNCVIGVPFFQRGTKDPVILAGKKLNLSSTARIRIRLWDMAGNGDRPRTSTGRSSGVLEFTF